MNKTPDVTYSPRPANNRAKGLVVALFGAAVAGFAASFRIPDYGGIVQLFCLFLVVYALYVASRFLFVSYTYSIYKNDKGVPYFLIEEKQGKRSSLVCQLPFSRIHTVKPISESKAETSGRYYTYAATMSGGDYYIVVVDGERGRVGIKIEPDDAFLTALCETIAAKRSAEE